MIFSRKKKNVNDILEEESKSVRTLPEYLNKAVTIALIVLGLYHIYIGFFGYKSAMNLRATHWLIISMVIFLLYPSRKATLNKVTVFDWIWLIAAGASSVYILINWLRIAENAGMATQTDVIFGIIAVIVVLEAARRAVGPVLSAVSAIFLLYAMFGHLIPGSLGHRQYTITRIFSFLYTGTEGIFGTALDVSAKYVALFVLFGAMLEKFGGGELFVDIAFALTGKKRGGPAKAAIVSSALMGTMSGSAVANVVTTGAFTIPLMKKNGYKPTVAGAVEAVASTGGQIMPPVMGAAAFLMAEMTGLTYGTICMAAILPAILYFVSVFIIVDLEAKKENIQVMADQDIKPIKQILKERGYLLIPLILLIAMIIKGYSAILAASYSMAAIIVIDLIFNPNRKEIPKKFFSAITSGMRGIISVAAACACAGIIVGVISLTGIGAKFSGLMLSVAGQNVLIALLMTMVASLILGCGLPTTAAYMVLATLAVPALIKLGVPLLSAHLFVLYFGSISTITPPVALSAYAGAALAGANPNKVGYTAFRFGIVAFIVPFMFVYDNALLLQGTLLVILRVIITSLLGVYLIAIGIQGYFRKPCNWIQRILAFSAGILMVNPIVVTDIIGAVCLAAFAVITVIRDKKLKDQPV
ncbi:MAG: TRAP transporter permease [Clostridiaceae bacterium]|nr:TRAP transporter permease [Clostridiaceae bacterium]